MSDAEVLIVGGGPAGAAAAIGLARAGKRVLVIERDAVTREKVCGEFLGPGATAALTELGVPPWTLGAVELRRARLAHGPRTAWFRLPFVGWGLPRQALDAALLAAAETAGAEMLRGRAVVAAEPVGAGWRVRLAGGETLAAPRLVLASGKHEMRGHARDADGRAVGLKLHVRTVGPVDGTVLLPAGHGYAGLQPTGGGLANLCMAIEGAIPRDGAALIALVASASDLGAHLLGEAVPMWPRPLTVARVPYGFLHRGGGPEGLYRIGDQFAVVPSFSGEGMGMALAGGLKLAEAIASGMGSAAFHSSWRRELVQPMRWAGAVSWLLGAAPGVLTRVAGVPGVGRLVAARTRAM